MIEDPRDDAYTASVKAALVRDPDWVEGMPVPADRPTVKLQGAVIVERDEDGFLTMFPDGEIQHFSHAGKVEAAAQAWFKKNLGPRGIGIGKIEWRDGR